jgi:hypothetical protein
MRAVASYSRLARDLAQEKGCVGQVCKLFPGEMQGCEVWRKGKRQEGGMR